MGSQVGGAGDEGFGHGGVVVAAAVVVRRRYLAGLHIRSSESFAFLPFFTLFYPFFFFFRLFGVCRFFFWFFMFLMIGIGIGIGIFKGWTGG